MAENRVKTEWRGQEGSKLVGYRRASFGWTALVDRAGLASAMIPEYEKNIIWINV